MKSGDCKFEGYLGDPVEDENLLSFLLGSAVYLTDHTLHTHAASFRKELYQICIDGCAP